MDIPRIKPAAIGIVLAAFCSGLLASHLAAPARAAAGFSPVEKLLAEDEIRQKVALYGLYADGSGPGGEPRDLKAMAETLMTPDVVSEIHRAAGGPPKIMTGRDFISKTPAENDPDKARRIAGRHYLVATVFDDVSASVAHTRTTAVYFDATKTALGPPCAVPGENACGGAPVRTIMWVYQMTWTKTPDGWQISRNVLRDDN
jgi:hypothetical protein